VTSTTPHQALYRLWRAQSFAGIVGQEATVTALRNAARSGRLAHALLFVGPRGTGKTSMARIVAKALNCTDLRDGEPCDRCAACVAIREGTSLDVAEMDAASNNRVDDMRELLPRIATAPSDLRRKVFIIDEVQRIKEGWDVLLKTLEEPPDHVAFIFCTTDAGGIRPAVLSRVQRFDFRRLTVEQIAGKLRRILDETGREADDDAVDLIARLAAGGMRDAESMLDQLLSGGGERLTADGVRDLLGLAGAEAVETFLAALGSGDARAGMAILDELEDRGRDPRAFLDQVLEALRAALMTALAAPDIGTRGDAVRLVAIGRRLATIDPARLGPGGLRFQLDLALLEGKPGSTATIAGIDREAAEPAAASVASMPRTPSATKDPPTKALAAPRTADAPATDALAAIPPAPPPAAAATDAPAPEAPAPEAPLTRARAANPTANPTAQPPATTSPATPNTRPSADARPVPPPGAPGVPSASDASASVAPASGVAPALADLQAVWSGVVADLSLLPAVKPLIVACRPISVEGRVVTLGFPEHQAFLKDALERRRATVEEGIARRTGGAVSVRFVATNIELVAPLPADAPGDGDGDRLIAEARRIFADDLIDVGEVS
jgi:DNA polymerase III subunit gamma/tau